MNNIFRTTRSVGLLDFRPFLSCVIFIGSVDLSRLGHQIGEKGFHHGPCCLVRHVTGRRSRHVHYQYHRLVRLSLMVLNVEIFLGDSTW